MRTRGMRGLPARSLRHDRFSGDTRGRFRESGISTAHRRGRGSRRVRSAARLHPGRRESQIPPAPARRSDGRGARHPLRRAQYLGCHGRHAAHPAPHAAGRRSVTDRMRELLGIMERLRAPEGCPWDREQTFASIAPYTIEEAYEVADAIERGDMRHLQDELGDLLFQVVFHAQMANEANHFDFEAVAAAICDKLRRRHPHVFGAVGPLTAAEQTAAWEEIKADERRAGERRTDAGVGDSHLDGVPQALPALMRAYKLSKRAARVGFDWEHASQTADKVAEELEEVRVAAAGAAAAAGAQAGQPAAS